MLNFCTLFDSNYLPKGLSLYSSLQEQCKDKFTLYILATNDIAYNWLKEQKFENVIVCNLNDLHNKYPILIKLKQERSVGEFNWTLSSFSIQFFLHNFNLPDITYLDADLFFYSDPKILFDELNENESVIITPHNYTPKYDQSEISGRYCVQFMYFKNNDDGNKVLEWWRSACEECCTSIPKDGKFGDQKYLDDWLSRFPGIVHEENHIGCGVAPWNVQQFNIIDDNGQLFIQNKITKVKDKLVFYHFHGIKKYYDKKNNEYWKLNDYDMEPSCMKFLYKDYINQMNINEAKGLDVKIIILPKNKPLILRLLKRVIVNIIKCFNFNKVYNEINNRNVYKIQDIK